jgi:carboxymethylenebutenolidase
MNTNHTSKRILFSVLASVVLCLSACDSGSPASDEADKAAGRANVDAMSQEHANDTAEPSPATDIAPSRPVISERLPYAEVDDELVYGHFVFPADMVDPLPAIIVIHEWWGLNDNVRAMADRLAGEGYIVLAVDLFGGASATAPEQARQQMLRVVENPQAANENMRQAYEFVNSTAGAPRIGSLGWCFGGGWSLNAAMLFPDELDATVIYYGQVTDDEQKLRPINSPILGLFGAQDQGITVESVQNFEAALERLRKNYDIHIYPGADHAFANPTGTAYNAAAAEDAWQRTVEFLNLHLAINEDGSP